MLPTLCCPESIPYHLMMLLLKYGRIWMMKVAVFQFTPAFGCLSENRSSIRRRLQASDAAAADLLVLPELAISGYNFSTAEEVRALSEPLDGPTAQMLTTLASETGTCYVTGFAEIAEENGETRFYNSSMLVGPTGVLGVYRKAHLFFREKLFFSPGNSGPGQSSFTPFEVPGPSGPDEAGFRAGILVCFDHMFPEAARSLALAGTQIVCHPSNLVIPEYAQLTSRVRALENRMFWLMANRCGTEPGAGGELTFTGCSQIVARNGAVLASAGPQDDELLVADIDPRESDDKGLNEHNNLFEDRRTDLYRL
jgi:predicted amidohydrolase